MNGYLASALTIGLLAACNGRKTTAAVESTGSAVEGLLTGTMTTAFANEGCAFLVVLDQPTEFTHLLPIALDEQYLKDGVKLSFTYRLSRASSGNCAKGQPAILENISVR
ncbi:MAG: hypothetical protein IPH53_16100 [Flavobacteriales bacterium]|nr:hypothetical protein [Flavobacteriales bacterium]MBK9540320.1 hypothetical protein [Flavobacteriales bacterium]